MKCRAIAALLLAVSMAALLLLVVFVDLAAMSEVEGPAAGAASRHQAATERRHPNSSLLARTDLLTFTAVATLYLPIIDSDYRVLYFEGFDDPASGWLIADLGTALLGYRDGEYEALVRTQMWAAGTTAPAGPFADYAVEVDARRSAGLAGGYGLLFNWLDWQRFYLFIVYPDSRIFAVVRRDPAGYVTLSGPAFSADIQPGTASNRLRAERAGSNIAVYCNSQPLAVVYDGAYGGPSYVGLHAESSGFVPVEMRFDNFLVVN